MISPLGWGGTLAVLGMIVIMLAASLPVVSAFTGEALAVNQTHQSSPNSHDHPFGEKSAPLAERHVYDLASVLSEAEITSIERDANRLGRFDVSVLVITTTGLSMDDAADAAGAVGQDWNVGGDGGGNAGLVFLIVVSGTTQEQAFATLSWSDQALPHGGITAADSERIQQRWINRWLVEPQVYEAVSYGLRRLIYNVIYDPAQPVPLSSAQQATQGALVAVAPLTGAGILFALFANVIPGLRPASAHRAGSARTVLLWTLVSVLAALSVWSQSSNGIICAGAGVAGLVTSWVRNDPGQRDRSMFATPTADLRGEGA